MTLQSTTKTWMKSQEVAKSSFVDRTNNKKWIMAFPSTQTWVFMAYFFLSFSLSLTHFSLCFSVLVHFYLVSISRWKFNVDIVTHNRIECDGFVFLYFFFHFASVPFNVVAFFLRSTRFNVNRCLAGVKHSLVGVFSSATAVVVVVVDFVLMKWRVNATAVFVIETNTCTRSFHLLNEKLFGLLRVSIYFLSFALPCLATALEMVF